MWVCHELGRAVSAAGRWPWPSVQQVLGGAGSLALCGQPVECKQHPSPSHPQLQQHQLLCRMLWAVLGCMPGSPAPLWLFQWFCKGLVPCTGSSRVTAPGRFGPSPQQPLVGAPW